MDRDRILLTPGPLTTTLRTKLAMLRDWGSWDARLQRRHRRAAPAAARRSSTARTRTSSCRCRAAAPSASRPRWRRSCRSDGHVLVLDNGAYCKRLGRADDADGPQRTTSSAATRTRRSRPPRSTRRSRADPSITHVGPDPLRDRHRRPESAAGDRRGLRAARQGPDRRRDELVRRAADRRPRGPLRRPRRRQRQVPRRRARAWASSSSARTSLDGCAGNSPVAGDGPARPARLHGEDRPVALHAADPRGRGARRGRARSSSRKAASRRGWRATPTNCQTLIDGMDALGFVPFLTPAIQAPIIVTFHAPADPRYEFKAFYEAAKARGFILYPGKLTQVETFRVGCIGAIGRNEMQQAVHAVAEALQRHGHRHRRRRRSRLQRSNSTWPPQRASRARRRPQVAAPARSRSRSPTSTASCAASTSTRTSSSSAAERRLRLLQRRVRLGLAATSATTTRSYTGWHTAFPTRWRGSTSTPHRSVPWDGDVPFFLGDFVDADGSAARRLPAPAAEARAGARREARLRGDVRLEFEWFNFRETPQTLGRQEGRRARSRSRPACSATRCCA